MRRFFQELFDFFRKGDMVLLALCLVASGFGCVMIASATQADGFARYVVVQGAAVAMGIGVFAVVSSVDTDVFFEHRRLLVAFNAFMILLLIPFGVERGGNTSWLEFPFLPFMIQPAEIIKITFVLVLASVMVSHRNRISNWRGVFHMAFHLAGLVILNLVISSDMGVSLIFVFIFLGMTWAGGVGMGWFGTGVGAVALLSPFLWSRLEQYQRNRILVLFDPSIDPLALDERWHSNQSLLSLTAGGLTGQGLFQGNRTSVGALNAQHTDFIFSAIGEELGFIGCFAVILLELAIIARCIWVGTQSPDLGRRLVCFGAASALIFQVVINVGMNLGMMPVIGLTLPFISYGGSSTLSLYALLGLVSGVYARPTPGKQGLYVQPPR